MAVTQIIQLTQKNWKIPSVIHAVQNDTGRELKMVIADEVYSSGTTAELAIRRSDVSFYSIETTFNASDNSFTADISQALTQAGITDCQLKVYVDDLIVSAYMFQIVVQESADGVPEEQLGYNVQDLMEAAEKIKGGGLTEEIKQALLNLAEKAAYSGEGYGREVYDDLYNAFYENTWAISANLSNASSSNSATSIEKGASYTTIISANIGYTLDGETVRVTMGGANVTSAVYSNGVVNIPAVTGDVVITVVAVALTVVSISAVYTQSGTVYDTDSLNSLKGDLVVTATFSDSSTEIVPSTDYTLSGTLTRGTSTITVSYQNVTTTFTVAVSNFFDTLTFSRDNWVLAMTSGTYGGWVWKASVAGTLVAARAGTDEIIPNNGYVFAVTDSSKYNLVAYNVTSDEYQYISTGGTNPKQGNAYPGVNNNKGWTTSDSSTTAYVALSFKKMDGTDFTDEELTNMYGTVFTVTEN